MALTIGLTSMDKATETALRAALQAAEQSLGIDTRLTSENDADYVIVDMDSMYGPMGWLRLHAAGKQVIGLTAAPRTQADFRLGRPFDTAATVDLLQALAAHARTAPPPSDAQPVDTALETPTTTAAAPVDADTAPTPPQAHATPIAPAQAPAPDLSPAASLQTAAASTDAPPPADPRPLGDWLQPGSLHGRVRLQREGSPALWIDADARTYVGPAQLKALDACFGEPLAASDFEPVDTAAWDAGTVGSAPQPLVRLSWYSGLLAGNGTLLPGHDPDARYRLLKWPQTEREFPRHFRIATAMMKGPATLADIARASGTSADEVADFVNASLVTGFAEAGEESAPETAPPPRQGLFSRFIRK
ncbi:hypothetical protein [Luteimonas abyssi]|uniref:hypothetical protein n=1 Tax=Luteimonas abyssi TaxID=1247514 RepID=UPI000B1FB9DC|nr:hypothetical protein [Luteimonas abyssi]